MHDLNHKPTKSKTPSEPRVPEDKGARHSQKKDIVLEEIKAFTDHLGLSPLLAGKKRDALLKFCNTNEGSITRKAFIENLLDDGGVVVLVNREKKLKTLSGNYLAAKELTKTGLEYANYLYVIREKITLTLDE